MASGGLLGALGGLGQGLAQVGKSWEIRRERALEHARELAKEERDRAFRTSEREASDKADLDRAIAVEQHRDRRTAATIMSRRNEKEEERKYKTAEKDKDRAAQRALVKLRGSVERDNSAAAERLRRSLSAGDVHAVQYGAPNAQGYAEVIVITKDGRTKRTGQLVYRPPRASEEDEDEGL